MIHFYGSPMSSAGRTHWMLEELGVPYEYHRLNARDGDTRKPEFLAINPGGRVPAIDDDGFRLFESIAINFYLAEKYGPEMLGSDVRARALVYQWSLWAITNLQPELLTYMFQNFLAEGARNGEAVEKAKRVAGGLLAELEGALAGEEFLVGGRFTAADVNAGSVVNLARRTGLLGEPYPALAAWMERLASRPAYQRIAAAG